MINLEYTHGVVNGKPIVIEVKITSKEGSISHITHSNNGYYKYSITKNDGTIVLKESLRLYHLSDAIGFVVSCFMV